MLVHKGSFTLSGGNGNDIVASVHTGSGGNDNNKKHPNIYKFAIAVAVPSVNTPI